MAAANQTQVAHTQQQWQDIAWRWQRAGQLMAAVPQNHEHYALAQTKVTEYQANHTYAQQAAQRYAPTVSPTAVQLPPAMALLAENRAALIAENRLYRAQLNGDTTGLSAAQWERLRASQAEFDSRVAAARLRVEQLQRQLSQVQLQMISNAKVLDLNQNILAKITPLYEEGGIAEVQYLQQVQEVETLRAEQERLGEEELRLQLAIAEAQQELANTQAGSMDLVLTRLADNEERIADIDSQLSKVIVENDKRIQEIDSQLSQTRQTLVYQELRAPVNGTVFDLQPTGPGFVANTTEPILKIVPSEGLVARVFITNQDIGFIDVANGHTVDVRIDSFPYSEFGDIKGKLIKVGSDALPPDEIYPFYRFPAEIELDQQFLQINDQEIGLQSGMSISVNIKTRKRRVITFLSDLFIRKIDSLRTSR
jgi:HlyD family secretion protein